MAFLNCDFYKCRKRVSRPLGKNARHPAKHPDFSRRIVMQLSAALEFWRLEQIVHLHPGINRDAFLHMERAIFVANVSHRTDLFGKVKGSPIFTSPLLRRPPTTASTYSTEV
ncbi:MAG: hypothetical protein WBW84_00230 [Acidobacteriaceae bacterium]